MNDRSKLFRLLLLGLLCVPAVATYAEVGVVLTDAAGKQSWPITGVSYILMHKTQANAEKGLEVVKFFDWAFKNGAPAAAELDYVPMPASVVKLVQANWKANLKDASGKAIY